ncbi:hypothetical protein [Paenibacillus abyssi]|uniref:Uncharacterized protein n=1 Tax=Paenibacillus abyssi TaxID=1340531 RepID=A0A917G573_9BACL|nr:hypothetical protein [Paenibacillus abyssi]GGG23635.1 hypothetical protein GCM10010916_45240 [Paenibacillus abyssi]
MDINTDSYKVAPINDYERAIEIIKQAEASIAELTGNPVTLIAYEKTEE